MTVPKRMGTEAHDLPPTPQQAWASGQTQAVWLLRFLPVIIAGREIFTQKCFLLTCHVAAGEPGAGSTAMATGNSRPMSLGA